MRAEFSGVCDYGRKVLGKRNKTCTCTYIYIYIREGEAMSVTGKRERMDGGLSGYN